MISTIELAKELGVSRDDVEVLVLQLIGIDGRDSVLVVDKDHGESVIEDPWTQTAMIHDEAADTIREQIRSGS